LDNPELISLALVPAAVGSVTGSLFAGKWMQKTGKYYWITIICSVIAVIGSTIIFLCSGIVLASSWGIVIGMTISAFGGGLVSAFSWRKKSHFKYLASCIYCPDMSYLMTTWNHYVALR
jgi:MFS family permease